MARVPEITGKGAGIILKASGRPEVLRQAIDRLGIFGTCGIVGATKEGTKVAFNVNDVMIPGQRIIGIVQGNVVAKTFIPVLIDLYKQGSSPSTGWSAPIGSTRSTRRSRIRRRASPSSRSCGSYPKQPLRNGTEDSAPGAGSSF